MNELEWIGMNEWNEMKWNERMNEWMKWINEWMNERNEWMKWMNEWKNE